MEAAFGKLLAYPLAHESPSDPTVLNQSFSGGASWPACVPEGHPLPYVLITASNLPCSHAHALQL